MAFSALSSARLLAIALCLCLCLLGLTASAQITSLPQTGPSLGSGLAGGPAGPPEVKRYALSGTVVNSQTGEGIPHAMVQVNQLAAMTDSNGSFSFDALPQGSYFVMANKPGFFSSVSPNRPPGVMANLGPDTPSVSISLAPESVIYGRITDSDGLPVQRFSVQVMRSGVMEGRRDWQPMGSKETDEDGYYRIAGLQPGTYLVVAGPSQLPSIGAMAKTGQQNSGYSQAFFPAPADSGATAGIHISAGQKISADMSVDAEPFYSITGTLNAPQGTGVWLTMTPRSNLHVDRGQSSMRGDNNTFTISMIPGGDYILHAGAQVEGKQWNALVPLHVAGDITGLPIVLEPSVSIPVTARVERTQATDANVPGPQMGMITRRIGAAGNAVYQPPPVQVTLQSVDNPQQQFGAGFRPPQQPGESPKYSVENIPPGTYKVEFHSYGNFYVASASYGSTDLLRENLVISHYAGADPIDIVLRDDGGKVKLTLTSDGQKANGNFLIVPDNGKPFQAQNFGFNGQGEVTLQQLRPGSYSILAFDDLSNIEYTNPDALEPYMSKAAHVDLSANQETDATIELQKAGAQ